MDSFVDAAFRIRIVFLVTVATAERFDVAVGAFVTVQIGFLTKHSVAVFALERLFAGVHSLMGNVVSVSQERLIAEFTFEISGREMDASMFLEQFLAFERLVAFTAGVFLGIDDVLFHVMAQTLNGFECATAVFANVWPFTCMDGRMRFQRGRIVELALTFVTFKCSLSFDVVCGEV